MPYQTTLFPLSTLSAPLPDELTREPFFLDPDAADSFDNWLQSSPNHFNLLGSGWQVVISRDHQSQLAMTLGHLFKPIKRSGRITRRELIPAYHVPPVPPSDQWMVDELQTLVFNGDVRHRRRAELLALARRALGGRTIHFISNCDRFDRIPGCTTYFVPGHLKTSTDWPIEFDMFRDLNLHSRVREVAMPLWAPDTFPTVVHEVSKALEAAVKDAYGGDQEGVSLMQEALSCNNSRNPSNRCAPRLPLNSWKPSRDGTPKCDGTSNERNEAVGYAKFFEGVPSALRNPTAHENFNASFSQERFGDKITTAKVLCFLSLLFEKLDKRP